MHARMEAHVALLNASVSAGVAELAASVQYVADRIKNEPGLTRPQVTPSLSEPAESGSSPLSNKKNKWIWIC